MNGNDDRRNPYLVLGLAYGASVQEVRRAFARRSKEVSRGTFTAYTMEDLNWALYQLEQSQQDPDIDVTLYRVPANPSLFDSPSPDGNDHGFFNPAPVPIKRTTDPVDPEEIEALLDEAVLCWVKQLVSPTGASVQIPYPFPN